MIKKVLEKASLKNRFKKFARPIIEEEIEDISIDQFNRIQGDLFYKLMGHIDQKFDQFEKANKKAKKKTTAKKKVVAKKKTGKSKKK